jgi:hypothetical protein
MSKKVLIDAFYSQFNQFLNELSEMYPNDADLPVFIETLNLAKFANPMMAVNQVHTEIVIPYGSQIEAKDEAFFLNTEYSGPNVDLNIIDKLKTHFSTMSVESKNTVWKYIDVITRITMKLV